MQDFTSLQKDITKISTIVDRFDVAIDLSPSRKEAALVASQRLEGDRFQVILLQTWHNPANLDDKAMANDVAEWVRYQASLCDI